MSTNKPISVKDPQVRDILTQSISGTVPFHPSPLAWEDQILYFLLPDRFSNGNEDKIQPFKPEDAGNATSTPTDAKRWEDDGIRFQGGTLSGVKSKLEYLKKLGVTAVWIGPIFKQVPNDTHLYHGYAVQDFLEIDPRFGSREDLHSLVKSAHDLGIYVILDIILNHSGDVFEYKGGEKSWTNQKYDVKGFRDSNQNSTLPFHRIDLDNPPEKPEDCAIWPIELQDPETFTCKGAISNWDNYPEYLEGDFLTLKDINLGSDNPDNFQPTPALLALCEVYKYWIAYADLDGYRIDTVKHMGDGPTRYLCTTLHEYASAIGKDNFFLVGEITGNRTFETVEATGLDAALGVGNVQEKLWNLPKGRANPAEYFDLFRNATFLKKGSHAWTRNKVVTMIDDHDQVWRGGQDKARFCSDQEGDKLAVAALALNLTTLGIPCIYYGTEQKFDGRGGSDRYIREAMFGGSFGAFRSKERHFFNKSNPVFEAVGEITELRRKYLALRRGRQYLREISEDGKGFGAPHSLGGRMQTIVAWSRIFAGREILCAINTDTDGTRTAYVTIDDGLHEEGGELRCVYQWPRGDGFSVQETVKIQALNGKAVRVSVPPSGFVVYA